MLLSVEILHFCAPTIMKSTVKGSRGLTHAHAREHVRQGATMVANGRRRIESQRILKVSPGTISAAVSPEMMRALIVCAASFSRTIARPPKPGRP